LINELKLNQKLKIRPFIASCLVYREGCCFADVHPGLEQFLDSLPPDAPKVFFSKKAGHTFFEHKFVPGTYLIFGKETMGLLD
jgi:tRNA(Leu) C34 or U34 (ribose-2'-O)-methylase TrmL